MTTYAYSILLLKPVRYDNVQITKQLLFVYSGIFITYGIIQTKFSDFNRCIFHSQYQISFILEFRNFSLQRRLEGKTQTIKTLKLTF
jgi:hypothetical protein